MKKEYKAPMLNIVNVETENLMVSASQEQDNPWANEKKNNTDFVEGETGTPETSKKFWDDEE